MPCSATHIRRYPSDVVQAETEFTQGGLCIFAGRPACCSAPHSTLTAALHRPLDNGGTAGWNGYGGSCLQWQRALGVGFGYAMNLLAPDLNNQAGRWVGDSYNHQALLRAVLECAQGSAVERAQQTAD